MKYTRKIMVFMLVIAFLTGLIPVSDAQAAKKPKTIAHAYYMIDAKSGKKILSSHANKKIYPASTAKLLTALTIMDYADLDQKIKYTKKLKKQVPPDASSINLRTGREYTVRQYLNMLLIASDACSAITLANGTAGSTKQFVEWMNDKAQELGMTHSHFDNPTGLDKGSGYGKTYTTAADFIKVSKAAMEDPVICRIVAKHKYKVQPVGVKKSFVIKNTNAFYNRYKKLVKNKKYKIIGSKTGTTRAAGNCLVATAVDQKGNMVICAFYGKGGYERLYRDIRKLFDYAFKRF